MQKYIKDIAFSLMGVIAVLLVSATIVEKLCGTETAVRYFYTAPWTIALWALAVLFGGWYVIAAFRSGGMRWSVFGIHLAFVVILLGAMLTHTFGIEGAVPLRIGLYHRSSPSFSGRTSVSASMPTSIMESSGSWVVKFCSHIPGADRIRVTTLSWAPTSRLNS